MAEQDRYASKFGLHQSALDKAKDAVTTSSTPSLHKGNWNLGHDGRQRLLHLANKQGVGAEQERYGTHFSLDGGHVKQFGTAIFELTSTKGVGAEQDRYGSHFSVDESDIEKAKQRVKDLVR